MSGVRAKAFWAEMKKQELEKADGVTIQEPVLASKEDLLLFHTEKYIDFVKKSSEAGLGTLDYGDTPAFKGMFESSKYVVGSTLRGLDLIMNKSVEHAFNPVGGFHHARQDSAAGFCIFNDAALAIVQAERKYNLERILYVDIDAHHGDGVFYAFYNDPKVFIADIHEDGLFQYCRRGR